MIQRRGEIDLFRACVTADDESAGTFERDWSTEHQLMTPAFLH